MRPTDQSFAAGFVVGTLVTTVIAIIIMFLPHVD